ncbi:DMT family transporter [Pediococcus ethanolidurans]|uniref:DMT family transporter n=1 Tax=Pediococcus ethanolidurans TaxID=319653 RepID=UPI001C1EB061|nr:DMT family transporter [Pediococcus ethanolidurans]MBU7554390.1 DMT family transporter [Pediococcus ethanolidurans]MBU7563024.1 DMT family transporter [Pediococcus ethanolidurans]MCT4398481.1 DMT family transporter [Pediococcus ethanolidurans]MCV3315188.1 DMT family transporter [Pediococcus ethanolidurans]MCV3321256.1 DMT family transporter [Pediococcus ethanolidurans]
MRKTVSYISFSTLMFSLMEIALKMAGGAFDPIQLNLIRFAVGGLVLLPIALNSLKKQQRKLNWKDLRLFGITGFICVIISMTLYQLAIVYSPAATVAVLFSCNPVFALIFSYLILHERLGRANLISVVVSVIGLLVIVNPAHLTNVVGLTLAVTSALTFGLYSIISRYGSQKRDLNGIVMTCFTFLTGTVELLAIVALTHVPVIGRSMTQVSYLKQFVNIPVIQNISWQYLPLLFFIGVCVTGGGFAFYFLAMETSDVSTASLVFFIKPALAPVLAALILSEQIILPTIIGIVIILLGSVITFIGNRSKSIRSEMGQPVYPDKTKKTDSDDLIGEVEDFNSNVEDED